MFQFLIAVEQCAVAALMLPQKLGLHRLKLMFFTFKNHDTDNFHATLTLKHWVNRKGTW